MKSPRFKIVVPSYQSAKWLPRTLESIEKQTYTDYDICLVDDASPNPQQAEIIDTFCRRNGWMAIHNTHRKWALVNVMEGMSKLDCQDDDVILVIDGDDWLFNDHVFQFLAEHFANPDLWLTYSQFLSYETGRIGYNRPVPPRAIKRGAYRKQGWFFCQLRAFRYGLWKEIRDEDLRGPDGEYFKIAYDCAIIYPMLEMAGPRHHFIPEVLYVYNDAHPLNDHRVAPLRQVDMGDFIRAKPRYKRLKSFY